MEASEIIASNANQMSAILTKIWAYWGSDLEARSQRCNILIMSVKEGREFGKHPSLFVADMLKDALGL